MKNKLEFNGASQRVAAGVASTARFAKRCAPAALLMALAGVRCYAASPFAKWMTDLSAEATSTWAITGAVIGLVLGLLGLKFGNHDAKGKMVTLCVVSFALLSVQGIVAYLQAE